MISLGVIQLLYAQESVPVLLASGDKPSFSYTECYNTIEDKKLRHCHRCDFRFMTQKDTLYFSVTTTKNTDLKAKPTSNTITYTVALSDILYEQTLTELPPGLRTRIKSMEGEKDYYYEFMLYSKGILKDNEGSKYVTKNINLAVGTKYDVEKFLTYLEELNEKESGE